MDDPGPHVLVVTKGDGDMGQGKVTLQGFQRWSPSGHSAVDSQRSSLELLELGPQKPWGMRPEDPGFWIPCIFGFLAAEPVTYRLATPCNSCGGGELMISSLHPHHIFPIFLLGCLPSGLSPFFQPDPQTPFCRTSDPWAQPVYRCHLPGNAESVHGRCNEEFQGLLT